MTENQNDSKLFSPGEPFEAPPVGDSERQAIDALRGYAYQIAVSALTWLDLGDKGRLYLEVAEDYASVAGDAIKAVQVKDTQASGSVTLKTKSVRDAIHAFVNLVARNPGRNIELRYFTTSPIGIERDQADRPAGQAGLVYWRKAAMGADLKPLRAILDSDNFSDSVREFVRAQNDDALRLNLLKNIHWDCGQSDLAGVRQELDERLIVVGRDLFQLTAPEARRLADVLMHHVLKKSVLKNPNERVLRVLKAHDAVARSHRF